MNRVTVLAETPAVRVTRFDHPTEQPHVDPPMERAAAETVNFLLRGSYALSIGRSSWQMSPAMLFVTRPGLTYRCRHRDCEPDDVCLSVEFARTPSADATLGEPSGPPAPSVVPLRNRHGFLRWRLLRLLEDRPRDDLALEALAAELRCATGAGPAGPTRLHRDPQLHWYAERVEAARETLATRPAVAHSLSSLARAAGMSPFHFARVFRELVGESPHRVLIRSRLRAARRLLDAGAPVTAACYDSGFNTLSHFSTLFRRHYGLAPSRYRRSRTSARRSIAQDSESAPAPHPR